MLGLTDRTTEAAASVADENDLPISNSYLLHSICSFCNLLCDCVSVSLAMLYNRKSFSGLLCLLSFVYLTRTLLCSHWLLGAFVMLLKLAAHAHVTGCRKVHATGGHDLQCRSTFAVVAWFRIQKGLFDDFM